MSEDRAELHRWYRDTGQAHVSMLRWYRSCGFAMHGGVSVNMEEPPAIVGNDIEYLPAGPQRIDGRDMTSEESAAINKLLEQMASDAIDALSGSSTLVVIQHGDKP